MKRMGRAGGMAVDLLAFDCSSCTLMACLYYCGPIQSSNCTDMHK